MAGWFDPAGIHTGLDFYRQIVESTHDCVKVLDLEGRLVYLTPKAQELLGICDLEGFLNRPTADQVSRMREPFYTTKPEGLGPGLAICREILRAHRSELQVERRRVGGLTFSFVLRTTTRANARKPPTANITPGTFWPIRSPCSSPGRAGTGTRCRR